MQVYNESKKKSPGFVFFSGFSFVENYWINLTPFFSEYEYIVLSEDYYKNQVEKNTFEKSFNKNKQYIGIGHSLGFNKVCDIVKTFENNFIGVVGLNPFLNFLTEDEALKKIRSKNITEMQNATKINPHLMIKNFRANLGDDFFIETKHQQIDTDLFLRDLDLLQSAYTPVNKPHLIIGSNDDLIVPFEITQNDFSKIPNTKIEKIDGTGHLLGYKKPILIYKEIMNFIKNL